MNNRYAGKCANCRQRVEAGAGLAQRRPGGRWLVQHNAGECQPSPAAERRVADHIDGFDRDDLGLSPDL